MKDLYDINQCCYVPLDLISKNGDLQGTLISSQSCNQDLVVAGNDNVTLLHCNGDDTSSNIKCDCCIEVLQWSSDGMFIALADATGGISIISSASFETVVKEKLPNIDISEKECAGSKPFFCSISFVHQKGLYVLAFACSNGKVFLLDQMDLRSISDETKKTLNKQWILIDALSCHEEALCFHCMYACCYESFLFTAGYGVNSVVSWSMSSLSANDCENRLEYSVVVNKNTIHAVTASKDFVVFTKLKQIQFFIFAICNQGRLFQFSLPHFFLVRFLPNLTFSNFLVKMPKTITAKEGRNLCKVCGIVQENSELHLRVYEWENMNEIYSLPLKGESELIETPASIEDFFYIAKGTTSRATEKNDERFCVMKLSQSSPDSRFSLLLQQHRYEEATEIATKYNLDLQPLFQHKAAYLMKLLSSESDTETAKEIFSSFKKCLANIDDPFFVGELCISSSVNDISMVYELLKIARDYLDSGGRLYRASLGADTADYTDLSLEVDRLLDLLVTFRMTFASQDSSLWHRFQSTKLSTQVASLLAAGNMQAATMLCSRHENILMGDIENGGEKHLKTLLGLISEDADVNDLVAWLELIIPAILTSSIQNSIETITDWLYKRALSLEDVAKSWPDDGIKIANVFFKVQRKLSTVGFVRDQLSSSFFIFNNKEEIARLKLLASRLQNLKTLRSRYQCNITLDEFIQETTLTLTFRMLDKVTAPELVAKCLENTVRPYMKEHKLDEDNTLLLYVKVRVESTLLLAKDASIPWSKDLYSLVEKALEIAEVHTSRQSLLDDEDKDLYASWSRQLTHCVHLEKIPALAAKYDIGVVKHGKHVNHQIFVRRLVRDERKDALDDAVTIASIFSNKPKELVYFNRLQHLIDQEKISQCLEILDSQPDLAATLAHRVYLLTTTVLESTKPMWTRTRANYCAACIAMMEYVVHGNRAVSNNLLSNWTGDLQAIKNIYNLQTRYGELVTIANYEDKVFKDSLLTYHVFAYYVHKSGNASAVSQPQVLETSRCDNSSIFNQSDSASDEPGTGDHVSSKKKLKSFSSLLDLARLLEIAPDTMMAEIALKAARKCQAAAAIDICKDLYRSRPTAKTLKFLREIALTLLRLLKDHSSLVCRYIPDICELVSVVAIYSQEKLLLDVATLCSLCYLSRDVLHGTDLCAGDFISKCVERGGKVRGDNYEDASWLNSWYTETDVLTLQSSDVLPLIAHVVLLVFDSDGRSLASVQPSKFADQKLKDLVNYLMKTTAYLDGSHRITSSLQWLANIESIMISHLSNAKALFLNKDIENGLKRIFELKKYAYSQQIIFLEALLKKVFLARHPDATYAIALLLALPAQTGFNLLNTLYEANSRNFAKIKIIAKVALVFAGLQGKSSEKYKFESLLLDATWAQRLHLLDISADCLLLSSNQWKKKYLTTLLEHQNITGEVLMDYCRDYDFDPDNTLIIYVRMLLSDETQFATCLSGMSSPEMDAIENPQSSALIPANMQFNVVSGQKPAASGSRKQNELSWEKVKEELKWICRNVTNKQAVFRQIERCLVNCMCPYDYAKAEFVLQLLLKISSCDESEFSKEIPFYQKASRLVSFLRFVQREQVPSEVELQRNWRRDVRGDLSTQKLPSSANTNLPLHPLLYGDVAMAWKVLSAEASVRSVERLIPIVRLLKLNEDNLYVAAADNAITRYQEKDAKVNLTRYQFAKLQALTEKIRSKKMATAMAKRIAEMLPIGKEKVDAYQWCLNLVSNWRESLLKENPEYEMASNAFQTLTVYYGHASCEHALAKHGCNSTDALNLSMKPDSLIHYLYQHPSIVTRFYDPGDYYPDIHALVDEVSLIYKRDSIKLRLKLIIDLLLAAGKRNEEPVLDDSTINLDRIRSSALTNGTKRNDEDSELIRLLYILTYDNAEQQGRYLMQFISNHKDNRITNACRVRALHCLFRIISDDQKLLALTSKTAEQLRTDLRVLIYLTELEEANFNVPASHLRQSNKTSVAQSIIASSSRQRNPMALRAAAEMCREFGSASSNMWIVLLQQLVTLKQVSYLQQLLPDICRIPTVLALPCLPSVWQSCVTLPIVALTPPLNHEQLSIAVSSYHFLIRCPVLLKIDLHTVANYFLDLGLKALALACLLILPGELESARKLAKETYSDIIQQLADLNTLDQPLLGYRSIAGFLQDTNQ